MHYKVKIRPLGIRPLGIRRERAEEGSTGQQKETMASEQETRQTKDEARQTEGSMQSA